MRQWTLSLNSRSQVQIRTEALGLSAAKWNS